MSVIARFEVIPVHDGSMSTDIARALQVLDRFPVSYETTPTDTTIEADSVDQLFAAVQAAHKAIPGNRVITSVEVDEVRGREQRLADRVESVQRALGRPPRRIRQQPQSQQTGATAATGQPPVQSSQQRVTTR